MTPNTERPNRQNRRKRLLLGGLTAVFLLAAIFLFLQLASRLSDEAGRLEKVVVSEAFEITAFLEWETHHSNGDSICEIRLTAVTKLRDTGEVFALGQSGEFIHDFNKGDREPCTLEWVAKVVRGKKFTMFQSTPFWFEEARDYFLTELSR